MSGRLKLRAEDAEDLTVVSACLQDALVPVGDLTYLAHEQAFVGVFNRYRWETDAGNSPPAALPADADSRYTDLDTPTGRERVLCALRFEAVQRVQMRGIDRRTPGHLLQLLAIESARDEVVLTFAGDATFRLQVNRLFCSLQDLVEPWPTQWRPAHDLGHDLGHESGEEPDDRSG